MFEIGFLQPSRRRALQGMAAAAVALRVPRVSAAQALRIGGTGAALAVMRKLATEFAAANPDLEVTVLPSVGSSGGIKAVLDGGIELAVSARDLKAAERDAGATAIEYGRTPFVFVTPSGTESTEIDLDTVERILRGSMTAWPDGAPVRLVLRPPGEAASVFLESLSPALAEAVAAARQRPGLLVAVTDQENLDLIENVPGAFGAATLAQVLAEGRRLRPLRLDGIEPSVATLATGAYPLAVSFRFVTSPTPSDAAARFIAYAAAAGRATLSDNGHLLATPASGT